MISVIHHDLTEKLSLNSLQAVNIFCLSSLDVYMSGSLIMEDLCHACCFVTTTRSRTLSKCPLNANTRVCLFVFPLTLSFYFSLGLSHTTYYPSVVFAMQDYVWGFRF